jgi:hypothetical protein
MTARMRPCARCGGATSQKILGSLSAGEAALRLQLSGLPVHACGKGHHAPVHGEFMLWLLRELRGTQLPSIPAGEARGLLFKKYHCACGAELPAQPAGGSSRGFDMAFPEAPAFRMEIETPLYKCAGCGKEQARSAKELAGAVTGAIVALNDAAGFPHSG